MNRRLLSGLAAGVVLGAGLPAVASGAAPVRVDVRAPHVLYGDLGDARGNARAVAARALETYAADLGVDAGEFALDTVRRSLAGTHVRGREVRDGVAVDGTYALVSLVEGRVWQVSAKDSELPGTATPAPIPAAAAVASALRHANVTATIVPARAERLLVANDGRLVDAYRVGVLSAAPFVALTYDVAAADGRLLAVRDENRYVDGHGTAFGPNPIVTSRNPKLAEPGVDELGVDTDLDSPALDKELRRLPLPQLDAAALTQGRLAGPWVTVHGNVGPSLDGQFAFTRGDKRFESTMAYAHTDALQRYLQAIGFRPDRGTGVNAEPQDVVTLPIAGLDNSLYETVTDTVVFGSGGVDDAEDAEIIVHELGHAMQDAQVPGFGPSGEGAAMGEGFGDFLAAAYFARTSGGYGDLCVAEWDATSYISETPGCLRRLDSRKKYPKDMKNDSHDDGVLWSALLWRLRQNLGGNAVQRSDNAIKLSVTAHEFLTPDARFGDGVAALRTAAKALRHPEWARHVDNAARAGTMPQEP